MTKISNQYSLTNILTADLANSRLGINNVSPTVALDVTGAGKFSGVATAKSLSVVSTNGYSGQIIQQGDIFGTSATNLLIQSSTSNGIGFLTNGGTTFNMFINSTGNVGIGTTTPDVTGFGWTTLTIRGGTTSGSAGVLELQTPTTNANGQNIGVIAFLDGTNRNAQISVSRDTSTSTANVLFYTNAGAGLVERMRITSGGQLLIGMSSAVSFRSDSQLQVNNCTILRSNDGYNGNPSAVIYSGNDQSGTMFVEFTSSGFSRIGSITRNGASNVSYNTGSDIRIKKNIIDAPTSLNKLNSIQVRSFDWVEDDAHQDFGFIAQELINVMPIAVTKGAKEKDIWQVDNSKLVPLLVKSIQELSAKVSLLENK